MSSPVSSLPEVFLALLVTIGLILALAWFLKKVNQTRFSLQKNMQVKSVLPLSSKERLMVVQVGQEQLLIGVAPGSVNFLKTLEANIDEDTEEELFSSVFSTFLKKALNKEKLNSSSVRDTE